MDSADLRRELIWRAKNALTLSPRVRKRGVRSVARVVGRLSGEAQARHRELQSRHDLGQWARMCNPSEYIENLYILDICARYLRKVKKSGPCLDIGCKNWSYLPALVSFTGTPWDGVELDAHRRYWTMATRRAYAEAMAGPFPGCRYRPGSLLEQTGSYRLITWFLPFVGEAPLRAWGLPRRFFEPERLLAHAWHLLDHGGTLFVVNQGAQESNTQHRLFRQAGITATGIGVIDSVFSPYRKPRFGWLARKDGA